MFIDKNPFPYLEQGQFAGRGFGEIIFLDDSILEEKKDWLREKYKEWWEKEQEAIIKEQIKEDMKLFVDRIKKCNSKEEAILLRKEIQEYVKMNNVSDNDNLVLMSGYGESLAMLSET